MSDAVREVEAVVEEFGAAWNEHDMARFGELFARDAQFVNVVGLWWHGRVQIQAAHEVTHRSLFHASELALSDIAVRFPLPDIAIARCRWVLSGHLSPEGSALPPRHGILVNVVQAQGGRWRIIDSQNTEVVEGVLSRPQ
jgi:uncharacterized protein (TIGR02246 family)